MHAPEVGYSGELTADIEKWDLFVKLAMYLGADRVTLHVPVATLETVRKNKEAFEQIVEFLVRRFAMLPNKCVIGVENMHMTKKDRPDSTRRFGYLPEECVSFMKRLQERCPRSIGLNLDIGHARNNPAVPREVSARHMVCRNRTVCSRLSYSSGHPHTGGT